MSSDYETPIPSARISIAKLGLDSREDLGLSVMLAVPVYFLGRMLIPGQLASLLAMALSFGVWRWGCVPALIAFRRRVPPKYLMHWLNSRVIKAPVLHPKPDPLPIPAVLPDPED